MVGTGRNLAMAGAGRSEEARSGCSDAGIDSEAYHAKRFYVTAETTGNDSDDMCAAGHVSELPQSDCGRYYNATHRC